MGTYEDTMTEKKILKKVVITSGTITSLASPTQGVIINETFSEPLYLSKNCFIEMTSSDASSNFAWRFEAVDYNNNLINFSFTPTLSTNNFPFADDFIVTKLKIRADGAMSGTGKNASYSAKIFLYKKE